MNLAPESQQSISRNIFASCRFSETTAVQPENRIVVTLLKDELGRVAIVHGADALLHPRRLSSATGRSLVPANLEGWQNELGCEFSPALASCHQLETIVDRRLLETAEQHWLQYEVQSWGKLTDIASLVDAPRVTVLPITEPAPKIAVCWDAPFDSEEIVVNDVVKQFTVRRIKQRLDETLEMPPLPETANKIIDLRNDPDADAEKLAAIIEEDPSLAAQIVGWASNSYFSAPGQIRSVQDAIVRVLGYDLVMNLAMGLALGKLLKVPKARAGELSFWQQAIIAAALNARISETMPAAYRTTYGLSYLTGLLHSFGYLILHHSFNPQFDAIAKLIPYNQHIEASQVELSVLGITREQIAVALLKVWRLPEEVTNGIKFLHQSDYAGAYSDYSQINRLALQTARQAGYLKGPVKAITNEMLKPLHLDRQEFEAMLEKFNDQIDDIKQMAGALEG